MKTNISILSITILFFYFVVPIDSVNSMDSSKATLFKSAFPVNIERVWVGPEYWANRLQDWQISKGRLECVESRMDCPLRTVHVLTRRLSRNDGNFVIRVRTGMIGSTTQTCPDAAAGILLGAGRELDYRAAALVHHTLGKDGGLFAGIDNSGRLFLREFNQSDTSDGNKSTGNNLALYKSDNVFPDELLLNLVLTHTDGIYTLVLTGIDSRTGKQIGTVGIEGVKPELLEGNLALVSHTGRFWFDDWEVSGTKIEVNDDRNCGPILSTQYSLDNNILKMTAQMMPLGRMDNQTVAFQILKNGHWKTSGTAHIVESGYTAHFRIENWDSRKDIPFRVVYDLKQDDGTNKEYTWSGTIRHNPVEKPEIVVAAFTGNHNVAHPGVERGIPWTAEGVWFPHTDLTEHVEKHKPDVLFFSGDQVYEGDSPTRPDREKPMLDYLYKWYLWCWAFRDLCRDIPSVIIPDDHDVFHGNLWGAGGRHAEKQDDGGYTMPADWVNMVQRTQTGNLPDPYDPTPVEQKISTYYTSMNYGTISFAIIEDRKFKSSPTVMIPEGKVVNGWFQNSNFDPAKSADVPGAELLGDRQLKFLNVWSSDWRNGITMKAVLSQTLFANVATLPKDANSDAVVPKLAILRPGDYPDDKLVTDGDSDAWPQTGRNKALGEMRRGFAVHICGDQHLGSTVQYGVDDWHDAAFALCVPSIANFFPRRWFPPMPGKNHQPDMPRYTGDYKDGFGNLISVYAVSNPYSTGKNPAMLYDKAPGYGIVKFNKDKREITLECWQRWEDPSKPDAKQYPGWPITIKQTDNYNKKPVGFLPAINVHGMSDPVIQVIDEQDKEIIYTIRIKGNAFQPKVFKNGSYTVKMGEPGTNKMRTITGLLPDALEKVKTLEVKF